MGPVGTARRPTDDQFNGRAPPTARRSPTAFVVTFDRPIDPADLRASPTCRSSSATPAGQRLRRPGAGDPRVGPIDPANASAATTASASSSAAQRGRHLQLCRRPGLRDRIRTSAGAQSCTTPIARQVVRSGRAATIRAVRTTDDDSDLTVNARRPGHRDLDVRSTSPTHLRRRPAAQSWSRRRRADPAGAEPRRGGDTYTNTPSTTRPAVAIASAARRSPARSGPRRRWRSSRPAVNGTGRWRSTTRRVSDSARWSAGRSTISRATASPSGSRQRWTRLRPIAVRWPDDAVQRRLRGAAAIDGVPTRADGSTSSPRPVRPGPLAVDRAGPHVIRSTGARIAGPATTWPGPDRLGARRDVRPRHGRVELHRRRRPAGPRPRRARARAVHRLRRPTTRPTSIAASPTAATITSTLIVPDDGGIIHDLRPERPARHHRRPGFRPGGHPDRPRRHADPAVRRRRRHLGALHRHGLRRPGGEAPGPGIAPYNGSFQPVGSLATLAGKQLSRHLAAGDQSTPPPTASRHARHWSLEALTADPNAVVADLPRHVPDPAAQRARTA